MHLRYHVNEEGKRVYTLKNELDDGSYTFNAHPGTIGIYCIARFSPDDVN